MSPPDPPSPPAGLEAVFLANRPQLLRFLAARGAGDAAEDVLQDLWMKVAAAPPTRPIAAPLAYLYRAADTLMIDRYRAERAQRRREDAWSDATGPATPGQSDDPAGERVLIARERAAEAQGVLQSLGDRVARVFRRHRLDGVAQRDVAQENGVSLSTVESDLRKASRALIDLKERWDEV